MLHRLRAASESLRTNFFFLPAIAVVLGFVGARLAVGVDVGDWVGQSTVDSARSVLSTTAAATITFASVTFSVSLLIMQQASNQLSPRVIHGLSRDPFNRRVIAVVVGTFTYCLVTLQRVRGPVSDGDEEIVPDFAVAAGLVLGVIAVLSVVAAINHTSRKMDVSEILADIVTQSTAAPTSPRTDDSLEGQPAPARAIPAGAPTTVVRFDAHGWIRQIDRHVLIGLAPPGGIVRLDVDTGRYAVPGAPLCTVWPPMPAGGSDEGVAAARAAVRLGPTRTMSEDGGYGVRQLVDVGLRALSSGVNDPTTAQDAIFHLGTVLVHRLTSSPAPTAYRDREGRHLLTPHAMTDDELADLAVGELRASAATQPAVCTYLLHMLAQVVDAAAAGGAADRTGPFLAQARLVAAHAESADLLDHDRQRVRDTHERLFAT